MEVQFKVMQLHASLCLEKLLDCPLQAERMCHTRALSVCFERLVLPLTLFGRAAGAQGRGEAFARWRCRARIPIERCHPVRPWSHHHWALTTEMVRWVTVHTKTGPLRALVFWAGPKGKGISLKLPLERVAWVLARACGHGGSCASCVLRRRIAP